jgi:hypothetical protein
MGVILSYCCGCARVFDFSLEELKPPHLARLSLSRPE